MVGWYDVLYLREAAIRRVGNIDTNERVMDIHRESAVGGNLHDRP
jgi:hypothetical protein